MTPFVLPISMIVRPGFCAILLAATIALYLVNAIIFNEFHLRRKNERVGYGVLILYYVSTPFLELATSDPPLTFGRCHTRWL